MYNTLCDSWQFWSSYQSNQGDAFMKRNTIITYLFTNKKQCLSDFWNVLSAAATTRFFIVSTSMVSVLVITGNVLVQLSHLKKRRGRPPQSNQQPKDKPSYQELKKSTTHCERPREGGPVLPKPTTTESRACCRVGGTRKRCGGVGQSSANKVRGHQDSAN